MFPVKTEGVVNRLLSVFFCEAVGLVMLHRAGGEAQRRRLIRLSSAGWLPPSVCSSRGCPRS